MASSQLTTFEGFSWPVPTAFRAALASCRFDAGDILYDAIDAYERPWQGDGSRLRYSIQVEATHSAAPDKVVESDQAFASSWGDGLSIALTDHQEGETRSLITSQGRLYSVLWRGDVALLELGSTAPEPPAEVSSLKGELAAAAEVIRSEGLMKTRAGHAFLLAIDQASLPQVLKARTVDGALRSLGHVETRAFDPGRLGIRGDFRPTILLHCHALASAGPEAIASGLKARLYKPAKERKAAVDRFSIERHGCLFELAGGAAGSGA